MRFLTALTKARGTCDDVIRAAGGSALGRRLNARSRKKTPPRLGHGGVRLLSGLSPDKRMQPVTRDGTVTKRDLFAIVS